jgi:glycosyltransferase involved in cell wall biosynthesis
MKSLLTKIKVIRIIEEGRVGGPQMDMYRITPHLLNLGIDNAIVLPHKGSSEFQRLLSEADIPFYLAPLSTMRKHPKHLIVYMLWFFPELIYLVWIFWRLKPDLVHVSGGSWQFKGALAGRLAGCKVIWHLNDTQTPKVLKFLFHVMQPLAHAFITAGYRAQKYYLSNEKKTPVFNISAPVDCTVFDPRLFHVTSSDSVCRIITIANISPVKGLELFIELAALLNKKTKKSLEFRVVGLIHDSQKAYFERLKTLVKKLKLTNLIFVGGVTDVRSELANADIYVCSSQAEASPTSVWEAMAMEKPVVSTNVGEVDHVIQNENIGLIVPLGDLQEIVSKIDYLLNSPLKANTIGHNARQTALRMLDSPIIAQQYFNAYQKIYSKI